MRFGAAPNISTKKAVRMALAGLGALDHVAVRVEDPDALTKFLTEVLGVERRGTETRRLFGLPGGVTLAVFPVGANQGGIGDRSGTRLPDHLALHVDSLDGVRKHLAAHGYAMDGDMVAAPGGLVLQFVGA